MSTTTITPIRNTTCTPIFITKPNTYNVLYDAVGGNNSPDDSTSYYSGDTVSVRFDSAPSLAGFIFSGWCSISITAGNSCAGLTYKSSGNTSFQITENSTLYAIWVLNSPPGNGRGYVPPPAQPTTVIEIPKDNSSPVVITPPAPANGFTTPKPERKVIVEKKQVKTIITIAPNPVKPIPAITNSSSDITIVGLNKNQRIKVTLFDLKGGKKVLSVTNDKQINTLVNKNPQSKVQIEIVPTLNQELLKGAQVAIKGAKKNQRVRVTIK